MGTNQKSFTNDEWKKNNVSVQNYANRTKGNESSVRMGKHASP